MDLICSSFDVKFQLGSFFEPLRAWHVYMCVCMCMCVCVCVRTQLLSLVRLFATPWTVVHQAPLFMGFSRQEYWSGLPFPFPGDLPDPGIKPGSLSLQADSLLSEPSGKPQGTRIGKQKSLISSWVCIGCILGHQGSICGMQDLVP